jgi:RNA polymerase-binding transcription factor DksA
MLTTDKVPPRLQQDLATLLKQEQGRLRRLIGHLATSERALGESQGEDGDCRDALADVASDLTEETVVFALQQTERVRLLAVEAALRRIHAGTYGQCEGCEGPIAIERLYADPWASLCIECARRGLQ